MQSLQKAVEAIKKTQILGGPFFLNSTVFFPIIYTAMELWFFGNYLPSMSETESVNESQDSVRLDALEEDESIIFLNIKGVRCLRNVVEM